MKVNVPSGGKIEHARSRSRQKADEGVAHAVPSSAIRTTIIDVALHAGVSPATVSNVLNHRQNVEEATRAKVLAAVRKLDYIPNLRARRLRTGSADTIAVFSSTPFAIAGGRARLGYTMEIAAAAASCAMESGIALVLIPPVPHGQSPFRDLHIDGALVAEPLQDEPDVALLLQRGVPVVSIGRQPGNMPVPYVDLQPYKTAELLIDHLAAASTRTVGLIVGAQPRFVHLETQRAYRDFARAKKMQPIIKAVDEESGDKVDLMRPRKY